jgi:hypothetical protein
MDLNYAGLEASAPHCQQFMYMHDPWSLWIPPFESLVVRCMKGASFPCACCAPHQNAPHSHPAMSACPTSPELCLSFIGYQARSLSSSRIIMHYGSSGHDEPSDLSWSLKGDSSPALLSMHETGIHPFVNPHLQQLHPSKKHPSLIALIQALGPMPWEQMQEPQVQTSVL